MRFAPKERLDRYEILSALGEGAFSETYEALDAATGALVVLKIPHPALLGDPSSFERFRREMVIARKMDHPGIQRSVDSGESRSVAYMVFEFVEGEDLRHYLKRTGPLAVERLVDFALQIADTLSYVHSHNVVHRDLKPENLLVTSEGRVKIADFGIALAAGVRRLTWRHLSQGLGTPDYMSPEQIQGERGDARTDLYALGIVLYELATGSVPFRGDNYLSVMNQHLNGLATPPRRLRPDLPRTLEAIIMRLMRKRPEERYQSAADLRADLDSWDSLNPALLELGEDRPLTGAPAAASSKGLWLVVGGIAGGFLLAVAIIIVLSIALR
jgi:eukaryotic-like serine/threonine-protein kinase